MTATAKIIHVFYSENLYYSKQHGIGDVSSEALNDEAEILSFL